MVELLTKEDIEELEAELEELKVHGRAEMAEKIRVAREFGDLSENAEYDIAKKSRQKWKLVLLKSRPNFAMLRFTKNQVR